MQGMSGNRCPDLCPRYGTSGVSLNRQICPIQNPATQQTNRVGRAGRPGRMGGQQVWWRRTQLALMPFRASLTNVLHILSEARTSEVLCIMSLVESKNRTNYRPVESARPMAGRRGGAGLGRMGRRRVDPARRQPSLLPFSESVTLSWMTLRRHEQTKSYLNRWGNGISG